jgi:hypothetical protein
MSKTDFIPQADKALAAWLNVLTAYLQTKSSVWGVPQAAVTELSTLALAYADALTVTENPATRTKVTVQAKNTARKAVKDSVRNVLKAYVTYNPLVSDADRDAMGLPIHKTTRTHVPVPTSTPEAKVVLPSPGVVEIDFIDSVSGHKAKPDGVHGVEIAWAILDTPPAGWNELSRSAFDTCTPQRLVFEGADRGKTIYFALRWENMRGEKGPWSEIYNAIIP